MADEVVGDRADGVGGAVEQVYATITVKVDRVLVPAGGHELTQAHGAGIAAA